MMIFTQHMLLLKINFILNKTLIIQYFGIQINIYYHQVSLMEKKMQINCGNGHLALKLCTFARCTNSSPVCTEKDCQYSSAHRKCPSLDTFILVQMLIDKSMLLYKEIDEPIIEFINRLIKSLQILKKEHQQNMDNHSLRLKGKQKELYQQLMNQDTKNLLPKFVAEVVDGIESEEEIRVIKEEVKRIKSILEKMEKEHLASLQEIRKLWKAEENITVGTDNKKELQKQPFLFDEKLCNAQFYIISDGSKVVEHIQNNGNFNFILISPSVAEAQGRKITLKMSNISGCIYIGMANKQILMKCDWKYPRDSHEGKYLIKSDSGWVTNPLHPTQNNKYSNLRFKTGDELEMEYKSDLKQLVVRNITTNTTQILSDITNDNKDLHYCIMSNQVANKVQIIENK